MRPAGPKALYYRAFALTERHMSWHIKPKAVPWADGDKGLQPIPTERKNALGCLQLAEKP